MYFKIECFLHIFGLIGIRPNHEIWWILKQTFHCKLKNFSWTLTEETETVVMENNEIEFWDDPEKK